MATTFTPAPEVRTIADSLIPLYHKHLVEHRVRLEYVFSDAEIETNGKARWGEARKIQSLTAFLAGEPEDEQQWEPLVFVCTLCKRWCTEEERNELEVNEEPYSLCAMCLADTDQWNLENGKVISKFINAAEYARARQAMGPPAPSGFFVITIFEAHWRRMRDETKRALVDHELMHCMAGLDRYGDVKLSIRPHDLEEFADIVARHGTKWAGDRAKFAAAIRQHDAQMTLELSDTTVKEAA